VTNALIHMDGTRLMGRWADLTGKPHPLSTREHILQYGQEFRGSLGHIALLGIGRYVLPFTSGNPNTAYAQPELDATYLDAAREQGGIAGYLHPYNRAAEQPSGYAGTLIAVDAALGKGDFYDIGALVSDEIASAGFYYRLLNCGFRIAATSGTDNFSDVWRDPPPGADRTYARIDGPLSLRTWMDAIKAQRTFGTTGPLVFFTAGGKGPGEEIALEGAAPGAVQVEAEAVSIAPMETLDVIVNGSVARTIRPAGDPHRVSFDGKVAVPDGGWVAIRVLGPPSKYVSDSYAFAQTSPVYVVRDGKRWTSAEDASFLGQVVDAIWARVDGPRARWRTPAEREKFKAAVDRARSVYLEIAGRPR
jgi:TolB protein